MTDTQHDQHPEVSADTVTRLAIALRDVDKPLFPRLKRLRLEDVDSQLPYLWFCVNPSLETLEVVAIPEHCQITISAFFKELVLNVPGLSNIILGPGEISASVLQSSVQFTHLRQLKITDAATSLDYGFLRAVAALRNLELFDIDARSATYTPYTPPVAAPTEHMVGGKDLPRVSESSSVPEDAFQAPDSPSGQFAVPFLQLNTLNVVSNVLLISDLIHYLFPREIEQISLTLVRGTFNLSIPARLNETTSVHFAPPSASDVTNRVPAPKLAPVAPPQLDSREPFVFDSVLTQTFVGDRDLSGDNKHLFPPRKRGERRFCKGYSHPDYDETCDECQKIKAERLKYEEERDQSLVSNTISQNTYFASLIEEILHIGNLKRILVDCTDIKSPGSKAILSFPELPSNTFYKLLVCPYLETLEIRHWALRSVDRTLRNLPSSESKHPLVMKRLYLPIDSALNSGITMLLTLASVAGCYPRLLKFQCRVALSSRPTVPDLIMSAGISHELKGLFIGGGSSISMSDKLAMAPYICFLFPCLEIIETPGYGQEAEDWKFIYELVKMCRKVRHTEKSLQ